MLELLVYDIARHSYEQKVSSKQCHEASGL